ncbi:MAG: hypothetical protein QW630_07445 [Sulfolobales archaeon]
MIKRSTWIPNLIVSYIDEADPNHEKAVELVSVFSRAGLEEPVALALYSVRSIKADMVQWTSTRF